MYHNIDILLATKHSKELAIREPFEKLLGAKIHVPENFDTDVFGTFTGEIPRRNTPYETVISKAKRACEIYQFDYGIANEGSFGPHPSIPYVPGNIELMAFVDNINAIVIVESEISTETNFAFIDITAQDDYQNFLKKIQFGSHGLILRSLDDQAIIAKGICEFDELKELLGFYFKNNHVLRLETDMRAMMNPTRMRVIHILAKKLVKRLLTTCKQCRTPGFGRQSVSGSLLCEYCDSETTLHQHRVLHCIKCDYQEYLPRVDGLVKADPQYCPYCNP